MVIEVVRWIYYESGLKERTDVIPFANIEWDKAREFKDTMQNKEKSPTARWEIRERN